MVTGLKKVALNGHARAASLLRIFYSTGLYVGCNNAAEALYWAEKALENGDEDMASPHKILMDAKMLALEFLKTCPTYDAILNAITELLPQPLAEEITPEIVLHSEDDTTPNLINLITESLPQPVAAEVTPHIGFTQFLTQSFKALENGPQRNVLSFIQHEDKTPGKIKYQHLIQLLAS
jgi:hypothetical protein